MQNPVNLLIYRILIFNGTLKVTWPGLEPGTLSLKVKCSTN